MQKVSLSLLIILFSTTAGCKSTTPQEHTSLAISPDKDPGPPKKKLSMVWQHHSTGDNLLAGGLLAALKKNNIDFYDINYKEADVGGYVIGDHTDPKDFPKNFNTPKYLDAIKSWELKGEKKQHDIVMFKSCYPSSKIESDAMLEQYKKWYLSMLPTFKAHPDVLFIGMSSPPLVQKETTPAIAKRARAWAKWVSGEYAKDAKNVQVFDLFNAMAVLEGKPGENMLVPQFAVDKWDSHPTPAAAKAVTRMFIPWFNRALRAAGFGG
ncbi:MAG: hypothetical protein JRH20_02765 [Deltaproteobacteria bacterium]|nr:hypothetical protein [Deltaproteobacteria bacterium]